MTDQQACPGCQHPHHAPGTECEHRVEHDGQRRWHLCLCLNHPPADQPCPPLMTCQGGTLGYSDVWYLQRGKTLRGANGEVITPDVLKTPAPPVDRAALRDRIAEALKGVRVWRTVDGCDGWEYAGTEALADALAAVLPEPADRAAEVEQLTAERDELNRMIRTVNAKAVAAMQQRVLAKAADRAAVLREAAAMLDKRAATLDALASSDYSAEALAARELTEVADRLRRMAAETPAAAPEADVDLTDGPVRCPLCPYPVTLHTPSGARAHFAHVHPEQRVTGRCSGAWPLLVTDGPAAGALHGTEASQ